MNTHFFSPHKHIYESYEAFLNPSFGLDEIILANAFCSNLKFVCVNCLVMSLTKLLISNPLSDSSK